MEIPAGITTLTSVFAKTDKPAPVQGLGSISPSLQEITGDMKRTNEI